MKKPVVLCIMDGFGKNDSDYGNAIAMANKPNLDKLMAECPMTYIGASGLDVGLPDGQMGNSEVGHTNIGAGRIVYQPLTRITKAFQDGEAYNNKALLDAVNNAKSGKALHLIGLVSPGGVHSHTDHLYGLLEMAKKHGVENVYVHAVLDGRDVPPASAVEDLKALQAKMSEIGVGKIASVMGRFYAMDRDNIWDRVEKAYALQWFIVRVFRRMMLSARLRLLMKPLMRTVSILQMNLCFQPLSAAQRVPFPRATALFSSISAPIAQEKSHAPLLIPISQALKGKTAISSSFMFA